MSMPPHLIRVKRKRFDDAPVTFLHLNNEAHKRHRRGSNWVYQRRSATPQQAASDASGAAVKEAPIEASLDAPHKPHSQPSPPSHRPIAKARTRTNPSHAEPRRFHMARSALPPSASKPGSKRTCYDATVFVEHSVKRKKGPQSVSDAVQPPLQLPGQEEIPADKTRLEQPCMGERDANTHQTRHKPPAPSSGMPMRDQDQDMDKLAADMNKWVLDEIGANLDSMQEQKQLRQLKRPSRFRPKPPAQRYFERHPQPAEQPSTSDVASSQDSQDDHQSDWVIDEYVRVPAASVAWDASHSDVGLLELDDDQESQFFAASSEHDSDHDPDMDDEDENAENHYAADYPEEEDAEDEADWDGACKPYWHDFGIDNHDDFDYDWRSDSDQHALSAFGDSDSEMDEDQLRTWLHHGSAFA